MDSQAVKQIVLVEREALAPSMVVEFAALFDVDGTAFAGFTGADNVIPLATIDSVVGLAEKTSDSYEPPAGSLVPILFTNGNNLSSFTVSFNDAPARTVQVAGNTSFGTKLSFDNLAVCVFYFDGTILHAVGPILP